MAKYELKEFKSWIEKCSAISSGNWNYYFAYFEPTTSYHYGQATNPPRETFEAIAQGKPKSSWNSTQLAIVKRWMSEVDEKERINKKNTDLENKLKEEITKSSRISIEKDSKIARLEKEKSELNSQLKKISSILLPEDTFSFNRLKKETERVMFSELDARMSLNKIKLAELVANSQEKLVAELKVILNLYLNSLAEKAPKEGKLEAYEEILGTKLNIDNIQNIKKLKKEVLELERKIASFPQEAQIQISPKK